MVVLIVKEIGFWLYHAMLLTTSALPNSHKSHVITSWILIYASVSDTYQSGNWIPLQDLRHCRKCNEGAEASWLFPRIPRVLKKGFVSVLANLFPFSVFSSSTGRCSCEQARRGSRWTPSLRLYLSTTHDKLEWGPAPTPSVSIYTSLRI